jgi:exosortase
MASVADRARQASAPGVKSGAPPWPALAWFGGLILLCYLPVLKALALQWYVDQDMGHGFFVPVVAAYIAWQRRDILFVPATPNYWGLAVMAYGAFQLFVGALGAELFLQRTAFIITLAGAVLFTGNVPALKRAALPILLLFFMIPLPAIVYNQITFRLQLIASSVAEHALGLVGTPVLRDGNVLELANGQRLNVVEACSGIRSLLSLSFLAVIYAYFFDRKVWMRWALLIAVIPIAVLSNAGRVTITGILSERNPDLAKGALHLLEGWVIFITAVVCMVIAHRLINLVYDILRRRRTGSAAPA